MFAPLFVFVVVGNEPVNDKPPNDGCIHYTNTDNEFHCNDHDVSLPVSNESFFVSNASAINK